MSSVVKVQIKIVYHTQIIHSQNHSYYSDQGIRKMTNGYRKFIKERKLLKQILISPIYSPTNFRILQLHTVL